MTYVDGQYISVARKNEMEHHEHAMAKLRAKIAQLTKAVAWESDQHQARLKELQQVEDVLTSDKPSMPAMETEPIIEPAPKSRRRKTKTKKTVTRSLQEPVAQLVA